MTVALRAVGRVRKAFGLKGELLVQPLTNEPDAIFAAGRSVFARDVEHRIEGSRPFKDAWLVKLEGVKDKTAADLWRGASLEAPEEDLTPPDENEVYLEELAGMRVRDDAHGEIGVVENWYEVPQGLVLEVRGERWEGDIPFNDAFIITVDRAAREIQVKLPEGLLTSRLAPRTQPHA